MLPVPEMRPAGTRFSLYPMGAVSGTSRGLVYPIDGIDMSPATRVGTSNEVDSPVSLRLDRREMLIILPRECLAAVLDVLAPEAVAATTRARSNKLDA